MLVVPWEMGTSEASKFLHRGFGTLEHVRRFNDLNLYFLSSAITRKFLLKMIDTYTARQ